MEFDLKDFEADLKLKAESEKEANRAVIALEKLLKIIDAKTIVQMARAVEQKNTLSMIGIAQKMMK